MGLNAFGRLLEAPEDLGLRSLPVRQLGLCQWSTEGGLKRNPRLTGSSPEVQTRGLFLLNLPHPAQNLGAGAAIFVAVIHTPTPTTICTGERPARKGRDPGKSRPLGARLREVTSLGRTGFPQYFEGAQLRGASNLGLGTCARGLSTFSS